MNHDLPNPFTATPSQPAAAPEAAHWGLAADGPPLNPAEVETSRAAVEVVVMWGDSDVLHVEHVGADREVAVGEGPDCVYLLGQDVLGTARLPVVVERGGQPCAVLPEGATGEVELNGVRRSFEDLETRAFEGLNGARLYAMPTGATVFIRHRGFTFLVRPTPEGREVANTPAMSFRRYGWVGLSLAVHAALLMMFYFMPPSSHALSLDQISSENRMVQYLDPASATEDEELPDFMQEDNVAAEEGGDGQRAADEEGAAGDEEAAPSNNRYAVRNRDSGDERLARENVRENMQQIGAIGALAAMTGTWDAPTSPYGADTPNGSDAMDAIGLLMGAQAGPAFGAGGAGMRGTGRGAGGLGLGTLGLGRYGTLGHGDGHGPGNGYGDGVGGMRSRRPAQGPTVRMIEAQVVGGMSRETIRRVVRRHLSEVRFCYEQGLQQNPSLEGRVTVNWIISPTGRVQSSNVSASTVGSDRVDSCIASAVRRWSFPSPDGGGPVGVNYPFVLQSPN